MSFIPSYLKLNLSISMLPSIVDSVWNTLARFSWKLRAVKERYVTRMPYIEPYMYSVVT